MKARGFSTLLDQKEEKQRGGNTKPKACSAPPAEWVNEIRTEAYYNFIKRGAKPGNAWEDWLKAESEVKRRHQLI